MADEERLDAMSASLAEVLRRQRELEERVQALESPSAPRPATSNFPAAPALTPPPLPPPETPAPPPVEIPLFPPADLPPARNREGASFETALGLNWINRIAVITLLLGTAFLFRYGIDNDWFGPAVRVGMGLVAAAIALALGHRFWKRGQAIFAQGLTGLGLALLYLSLYAASTLYQLLPQAAAFALMSVTTVAAARLALLYGSQVIAALAMIGGYLTPPALSTREDHPWILFSYVSLLNLGGFVLARKGQWAVLEPLAAGATILLYAAWFGRLYSNGFPETDRPVATFFAIAFYAQFAAANARELWAIFQFAASLAIAAVWRDQGAFLFWNLLFVAAGLAWAFVRRSAAAPLWALACYWIPFWTWYRPEASFAALSAVFTAFFAWNCRRAPEEPAGLALVAANPAAYFAASYSVLNPGHHSYMGLFAAAIGGLHLLPAWQWRKSDAGLIAFGVALAFATLAIPIQFAGFRITIAWALEGAALAWIGRRFPKDLLQACVWAVFVLVLGRLFLSDMWMYSSSSEFSLLANARFLTFAVTTASLWLAASFSSPRLAGGALYVASHPVLLVALGLEIGGWVERNIAPEDQTSVRIVALSVMMALYAVVLILVGVKTRAAIHRILGLALVGLVVIKLYLLDVWMLGRVFRITAFLALGALLLAVSYLYSRFRPVLERLWKPDDSA